MTRVDGDGQAQRTWSLVALVLISSGCAGNATAPPKAAEIRGATACDADAPRTDVLLVDLMPEVRADLEAATRRGLAVVRFDCQSFEVLSQCSAEANYAFTAHTPKEQLLRMSDSSSLGATLPLSYAAHAGELSASFEQGQSLDLALVLRGRLSTTAWGIGPEDLRGDCRGATHVLGSAEVGAFALHSGARDREVSSAGLFGLRVHGSQTSRFELHSTDGSPAACSALGPEPLPGCDALLRAELVGLRAPAPLLTALTEDQMQSLRGKLCEDLQLCRTECERDDGQACMHLAAMHLLGDRTTRDLGRAGKLMLRACELDQPLACTLLGIELLNEASPRPDLHRGREFLRRPCERGYSDACHALGLSYSNAGDTEQAQRYLNRACTLGASAACN